jgi:hypothetical protein
MAAPARCRSIRPSSRSTISKIGIPSLRFLPPNFTNFCLFNLRGRFPKVFFKDGSPERDAHGMALTTNRRYLWQFDRLANKAEVFRTPSTKFVCPPPGTSGTPVPVGTVNLVTPGVSDDLIENSLSPDIVATSPLGNRFYLALRGPKPQTGAHAAGREFSSREFSI